jgi:WD40 repeat protein
MESFSNENIIKLIFKNYTLREITISLNKLHSNTLSLIIQQIVNYKYIFTSKRKHFTFPDSGYGILNLYELTEGQILGISSTSTKLWDIDSYKCISMATNNALSSAMLTNGQLVTFTHSGLIQFWHNDRKSIEKTITLEGCVGHRKKVFSLANGNLACSVFKENQDKLLIIDYQTTKVINTLNIQLGFINSIINLSNEKFASCTDKGTINIWDMKDYNCLTSFYADFSAIKALLFEEKRNLLISGSISLKIWDVNYSPPECILVIHDVDVVHCLLLLPDGYFASSGRHGRVKIWSLDTFHCINKFKQPEGHVDTILLLLKDYRIVSSSGGEIVIWDY